MENSASGDQQWSSSKTKGAFFELEMFPDNSGLA